MSRVCFRFFVTVIAFAVVSKAVQRKRGVYSLGYADLPLGVTATYGYVLPYSSLLASYPISNYLDVQLQQPLSVSAPLSSVEKPVTEPTLEPPPPSNGASITLALPQTNIFSLGSGSLGAVQLSDGRLALGSGSLGYTQHIPSTTPNIDLILQTLLQQNLQQQEQQRQQLQLQPPPSYINDRRPQNFGIGGLPNPPQQLRNLNPPPPETRGYSSTPGLSSARS